MKTVMIATMIGYMLLSLLPFVFHNRPFLKKIIAYDPLFFLPHWKMFSRDPIQYQFDHYVLYRDKTDDGGHTPWQPLEKQQYRHINWLWNPFLWRQAMSATLGKLLISQLSHPMQNHEASEVAFEILTARVLSRPKISAASIEREFCLVKADLGEEANKEVFYSKPYPIKHQHANVPGY